MHSVNAEVWEQLSVKEGTSKRGQMEGGDLEWGVMTQMYGNAIIKPVILYTNFENEG